MINHLLRIVTYFLVALIVAVAIHAMFYFESTLRLSDREYPYSPSRQTFDLDKTLVDIFDFLSGVNRFLSFNFADIIWAVRIEMVLYFALFFILLIPNRRRLPALVPYALPLLGLATVFAVRQFGSGFFFLPGVPL